MRSLAVAAISAALTALAGTAFAQKTQLLVYTALETDQLKAYQEGFARAHPEIDIKWVRDSTGVITAKLIAEKANPQADVVMGVAASSLALMDQQIAQSRVDLGVKGNEHDAIARRDREAMGRIAKDSDRADLAQRRGRVQGGREHNLGVVSDLSTRISVLSRGRMLVEGSYAEVAAHPDVRSAYLGSRHA